MNENQKLSFVISKQVESGTGVRVEETPQQEHNVATA